MKKLFTIGFLFSFLLSIPAFAQVLLEEQFDQPAGTALTTFGWTQTGTSTTNPILVVSPGLTYSGYDMSAGNAASLTTTGQDIRMAFSDTAVSTGAVYAAFLVNVTSAQTGDYFAHFLPFSSTTFTGRVFVKLAANGNLAFGLSKSSTSTTIPAVYTDSVYSTGTTYLMVLKYDFGTADTADGVASLFINPDLSAAEPTPTISHDTVSFAEVSYLGGFALRQGSTASAPNVIVDGIRVAKSWSELYDDHITIAEAIVDADSDYVPDKLNDTVHVKGIVISPNYQTSNRSYYIYDGTAGIATFQNGLLSPALNLGDEVDVRGVILHYNGLTEIDLLSDSSLVVLSDSNTVPEPKVLTISEFFADPEEYESELVAFTNLTKKSGTWPASGSSANLVFTNGTDTIVVRVDSDTDIDGQTEPTYPVDIIGVITQFKSGAPYTSGYQLQPRYFATDFLPAGTLPVELVSLSATSTGSSVRISWSTASEKNNRGFEVERKEANGSFRNVGFVSGNGTTTQQQVYSFVDANVTNGKYSYRLKQVDYDGTYKYSDAVEVSVNVLHKFALDQNFPNPFNPSTTIKFTLSVDSKVNMKVYNVLGQEITTLINSNYVAGPHEVKFNASNLNSGVYFYKLIVNGIDGSSFSSVKKMILAK